MTIKQFRKLLKEALKEAELEILAEEPDLTDEELKELLLMVQNKLIQENGIDPQEFLNYEESLKEIGREKGRKKKEELQNALQETENRIMDKLPPEKETLAPEAIKALINDSIKKIPVQKPQIINKIERVVEKPKIIREKEIIKEVDKNVLTDIKGDIQYIQETLSGLKIPEPIDLDNFRKVLNKDSADIANKLWEEIPNFRMLAMGLQGQIDETKSLINAENLWDRTLTTISPHTAGDSLDMVTGNFTTTGIGIFGSIYGNDDTDLLVYGGSGTIGAGGDLHLNGGQSFFAGGNGGNLYLLGGLPGSGGINGSVYISGKFNPSAVSGDVNWGANNHSTTGNYIVNPTTGSSFTTPPTTAARTGTTGVFGYQYEPTSTITVLKLGRLYVAGNNQNHTIKIWDLSDSVTPVASATILAASDSDANNFKWVDITPVTLIPTKTYAVVVDEGSTADAWKDNWATAGTMYSKVGLKGFAYSTAGLGVFPTSLSTAQTMLSTPAMWITKEDVLIGSSIVELPQVNTGDELRFGAFAPITSFHFGTSGMMYRPSSGRAIFEFHSSDDLAKGVIQAVSGYGIFIQSLTAEPTIFNNNFVGSFVRIDGSAVGRGIKFSSTGTTTPVGLGLDGSDLRITDGSTGYGALRTGTLKILEGGATPTKFTIFQGGDQAVDLTYTLPTAYPASVAFLKISNAGVMTTDTSVYLTDAPSDGTVYGRQNGSWAAAGGSVAWSAITGDQTDISLGGFTNDLDQDDIPSGATNFAFNTGELAAHFTTDNLPEGDTNKYVNTASLQALGGLASDQYDDGTDTTITFANGLATNISTPFNSATTTNRAELSAVLAKIDSIKPYTYSYGDKQRFGFLADEVAVKFPSATFTDRHSITLKNPVGEIGYRKDAIIAIMWKAIQELNAKVKLLEAK